MLEIRGYRDFATASQAVLKLLRDRIQFDLWMVTRVVGNDWIVLQAEDHGYGFQEGNVFAWADSFCSEMVRGNGPCIAPQCHLITAYRKAPINQQVTIGAYVGVPLCCQDGNLFGTLCGIHPTPVPGDLEQERPLIEVLARLLSSLLDAEMNMQQERRRAERAEVEAQTDALTGLYNRRGWNKLLAAEEKRCQTLGCPACVMVIDLDNLKQINDEEGHEAGDRYLCRLAQTLKGVLRQKDVAARIGGDEFAVLGVELEASVAQSLRHRLQHACTRAGVNVSIGLALRNPAEGLAIAWHKADTEMYRQKRMRRASVASSADNRS